MSEGTVFSSLDIGWMSQPVFCQLIGAGRPLERGDRVRIKEGYDGAGNVYYYIGKDIQTANSALVADTHKRATIGTMKKYRFLADAIEPYPYTREERIERAIEDYQQEVAKLYSLDVPVGDDCLNLLFAILDAGV